MPTHDSPGLLTLLGHELRAPAGVIGGYLTMIERHPLGPDQTRALDGARRAQQTVIEILDDVRRLLEAWQEDAVPGVSSRSATSWTAPLPAAPSSTSISKARSTRTPISASPPTATPWCTR